MHNSGTHPNAQFRFSPVERTAIVATLPTQDGEQCSRVIARLEQAAREFRTDRARRLKELPAERRERQRRLLAAIEKAERLAIDAQDQRAAAKLRELQAPIDMSVDAYKRLARAFHGTDLDVAIFYFRALSIWSELGGGVRPHYVSAALRQFLTGVTAPVLGPEALKAASFMGIVRRFIEAQRHGSLGTVQEFKVGQPLIADVDHFIILDSPQAERS